MRESKSEAPRGRPTSGACRRRLAGANAERVSSPWRTTTREMDREGCLSPEGTLPTKCRRSRRARVITPNTELSHRRFGGKGGLISHLGGPRTRPCALLMLVGPSKLSPRRKPLTGMLLVTPSCTPSVHDRYRHLRHSTTKRRPVKQASTKPSSGLEPETPSLPWRCSTN